MVAFQQQSPQRLVDEYEHMNSRNNRLDLRLNSLQREYYFIKYGKSYVINCNMVDFQQQSPQRLVDEYEHMNSRNDRLDMRLN